MSLAGKRNDFTHDDLLAFAANVGVKTVRAKRIIDEVAEAVGRWRAFAEDAGVEPPDMSRIEKTFCMTLRRD
jgi:serine/threonine-protein kinase HipA